MPSAGSVFVSLGLDFRNLIQGAQKATQTLKSIEDFSAKLQIKGPDAKRLIAVRDTLAETTALYKDFANVAQSATTGLSNSFSSLKGKIQGTSAILTKSFANINAIMKEELGTAANLKDVHQLLTTAMMETNQTGRASAETLTKIGASLGKLTPEMREAILAFGSLSKAPTTSTFDKMRNSAMKFLTQGLNPVTAKLLEMQIQLAKEFRIVTAMDKATVAAAQLRQKIDTLTEAHSRGIVSIDSLSEKYKAYQQLQKLGESLSTKQVTDMNRTGAAIKMMSQNAELAGEVQKRLIADRSGIAGLGTGYEAAGTKLQVMKQTVDTLLTSFHSLNSFTQKELAGIKKKATAYQQQTAVLTSLETSLKRVSQLEQTLSKTTTTGTTIDAPELGKALQEFEALRPSIEKYSGALGASAIESRQLDEITGALLATENQLGIARQAQIAKIDGLKAATATMGNEERRIVEQLTIEQNAINKLQASYTSITATLSQLRTAKAQGIQLDASELSETNTQIETLKQTILELTGISIGDVKNYGIDELIAIFAKADVTVRKSVNELTASVRKLRAEGAIKLAASNELLKSSEEVTKLKDRLQVLNEAQRQGGDSLVILTAKLKTYQAIQARGLDLTTKETTDLIKTASAVEFLSIQFATLADLQKKLQATIGMEKMGQEFEAATARMKIHENETKTLMATLAKLGGVTASQTDAEERLQKAYNFTATSGKNLKKTINDIDKARKLLQSQQKLEIIKPSDARKAENTINKLNKSLKTLGLEKITIGDTSNLDDILVQLDKVKAQAKDKTKELISGMQKEMKKFTVDFRIEGLEKEQSQNLQKITQDLKVLGEQEKRNIEGKKAHTERISAMNKAMASTEHPMAQAKQFLKDELVLRQRSLDKLNAELRGSPASTSLMLQRNVAQNQLNRATSLYNRVSNDATKTDKERKKTMKDLNKYTNDMAEVAGKASGRYAGLSQAVGGLIGDMKNLVRVQIRWYATQSLIFGVVRQLKETISFYIDLEAQVARVTSVLSQEYDLVGKTKKVMSLLRKEMVRTGESADRLATTLWELVSAGISQNEAMAGLAHVTNLSVAAELELAETTRITAGLYRVFGDQITQATDSSDKFRIIVDSLAATLNQSQVDMDGLVAGLGYLINEGDAAGLSMNQVLSVLSVLNNRLLLGSKAGRAASRVLTQLTSNADKLAESFNLKIDFTKPLDLIDILEQLNVKVNAAKVNGQITVETFAKLQDVFGQIGKRAAIGLIENIDELKSTISELETDKFTDLTEQMAQVKLGTFERELKRLSNTFKIFTSDIISPMVEGLQSMAETGLILLGSLSEGFEGFRESIAYSRAKLGAVYGILKLIAIFFASKKWISSPGVFQAVGFAAAFLWRGLWSIIWSLTIIGPLLSRAKVGMFALAVQMLKGASAAQILGRALLALKYNLIGIGVGILIWQWNKWAEKVKETKEALGKANKEYAAAKETYEDAANKISTLTTNLKKLSDEYNNAIPFTRDWYLLREKINKQYPGLIDNMDAEITSLGDTKNAIEDVIEAEKKKLALDYKKREVRIEAEQSARAAAKRASELFPSAFGKSSEAQFSDDWLDKLYHKWRATAGMKDMNEEAEEFKQTVENLQELNMEIPESVKLFVKAYTGINEQTDTVLNMVEALKLVREEGGKVDYNFMQLKTTLDSLLGPDFTRGIDFTLNANIDKGQIDTLINDLQDYVNNSIAKTSKETQLFSDYQGGLTEFKKRVTYSLFEINRSTKNLTGDIVIRDAEKTTKLVLDLSDEAVKKIAEMPEALNSSIEATGENVKANILSTIAEARNLAEEAEGDFEKTELALWKISNAVTELSTKYDILMRVRMRGSVNQIQNLLQTSGRSAGEGTRKEIEQQLSKLSAYQVEIVKTTLGLQYDAFKKWITEGGTLAEWVFEKITKSWTGLVATYDTGLDDTKKSFYESLGIMFEGEEKFSDSLFATKRLMEALGQGGTEVTKTFLDENKKLLDETSKYLPQFINDMITSATNIERAQITKVIRGIKKEIDDDTKDLGITLTPDEKAGLAVEKFKESYDDMTTASDKFYKESLEASSDYVDELTKQQLSLSRSVVGTLVNTAKLRKEEAEIREKYQTEEISLTNKISAAKKALMADNEDHIKLYKRLEAEVSTYTEAVEKADKAMQYSSKSIGDIYRARERFGDLIFDESEQDSLMNIVDSGSAELSNFLKENDESLLERFTSFFASLEENEARYIRKLFQVTSEVTKGNLEASAGMLQKILLEAQDTEAESLDESTRNWLLTMQRAWQAASDLSESSNADLITAREEKANLDAYYNEKELSGTRENNALLLKLQRLRTAKERDLLVARQRIYAEHYRNNKAIRDRELQHLEDYANAFGDVFTKTDLQKNLNKRLEIMELNFRLERAFMVEDIRQKKVLLKRYNEDLAKEKELASKPKLEGIAALSIEDKEFKTGIDEKIKAETERFTTAKQLYEDALNKFEARKEDISSADQERLRKDVEAAEDAVRLQEIIMVRQTDSNKEQVAERIAANELEKTRKREDLASNAKDLEIYIKAGESQLKNQLSALALEYAAFGKDAAKQIVAKAQEYMNTKVVNLAASLTLEGIGPEGFAGIDVEAIAKEMNIDLNTLADMLKKMFKETVREIGKDKIPIAEQQEWIDKFDEFLGGVVTSSTDKAALKLREGMSEVLAGTDFTVDTMKPIMEIDIATLVKAGFDLEEQIILMDLLNAKEKERNELRRQGAKVQQMNLYLAIMELDELIKTRAVLGEEFTTTDAELTTAKQKGDLIEIAVLELNKKLIIEDQKGIKDKILLTEDEIKKIKEEMVKLTQQLAAEEARLRTITALNAKSWAEFFDGFEQGAKDAWKTWSEEATNASKIAGQLITGILDGFNAAIMESMEAIFIPPEEEIQAAEDELQDLVDKKAEIQAEMDTIAIGGVSTDQVQKYNDLKKQFTDINKEIKDASQNLDELGDTSKRVGDAFRKFGADVFKMLAELIIKMMIALVISKALQGIFGGGQQYEGFGDITQLMENPAYLIGGGGPYAKGGVLGGGFTPFLKTYAKGGVIHGGFVSPEKGGQDWLNFVKYNMGAKLFAAGGVASSPTLGLVGEAGQNEAVVPLPDNRNIPVKFVGDEGKGTTQEVKIMNIVDPAMIPSIMMQNPDLIVNIISEDLQKRGPIFHQIKQIR